MSETSKWIEVLQSSTKPAYQSVVDAIRSGIADGSIAPDERLPTHRELAAHLGLARGTVMRAYQEAERSGLVRSTVGRGTFVVSRGSVHHPQDRAVDATSGVVDLSANRPLCAMDPSLAPVLAAIGKDANLASFTRYTDVLGHSRHRSIGKRWLERWGVDVSDSQVAVCAGSQHAVFVALSSVAGPGDAVATDALTYASLLPMAHTLGLRLVGVGMDSVGMKPSALDQACGHRPIRCVYLTPTIQNPTGIVMDEQRRRELLGVVRRRGLMVIEDDIHRLYHESPPLTMHALEPGRVLFIAATSKSVAGGVRVAFLSAPRSHIDQVRRSILSTVWNVPPLMAEIATRWIEDGTAEQTVRKKRTEMIARHAVLRQLLASAQGGSQSIGQAGLQIGGHAGGLSAWIRLPDRCASSACALAGQGEGVLVAHQDVFEVGDRVAGPDGREGVRISLCAAESRDELRAGIERFLRAVRKVLDMSRSDLAQAKTSV
jgi:DNA-binding transcriptional MocR family regulator